MAKCNDCELCTQGLLGALHKATAGGQPTLSSLTPAAAAPFRKKCVRCFHELAEHEAFKVQIAVLVAQQATHQGSPVGYAPAPVPQAPNSPLRSRCEHCGASFPEARKCPECGANAVLETMTPAAVSPLAPPAAAPAPTTAATVAAVVAAPVALLGATAAALSKGGVPWHKRLIVVVPALVLLAPVGIALIWAHKLWARRTRILVTIASAGFFVTAMVGGQLDKRAKERSRAEAAAKEKESRDDARATKPEQPRRDDTAAAAPPVTAPHPVVDAAAPVAVPAPATDAADTDEATEQGVAKDRKAEQKRLKSRRFVDVTAEALARKMLAADELASLWESKYVGKYVKWSGKYERKGVIVDFVASGGGISAFSCKGFDAAHDPALFTGVETGDDIRVEGRLDGLQQQLGKEKVEFVLTECIAEIR